MAEKVIPSRQASPRPTRASVAHERVRVVDVDAIESMASDSITENDSLRDFGEGSPLIMTFVERDGERQLVLHTLTQERNGTCYPVERVRRLAYRLLLDGDTSGGIENGMILAASPLGGEEPVRFAAESLSFRLLAAETGVQSDADSSRQPGPIEVQVTSTDEQPERQSVCFHELDT